MECNRDDAIRSKEVAERKFKENDFAGAKKFALKAKALFELEGIDQMILALDVHLKAQTKFEGEHDWYGILEVSTFADEETIRKQYKKLALQTHPDKNRFIGADGAFKLISDAWNALSDKNKRILHDHRRHMSSVGVHQNNSQANVQSTSSSSMPSMNGFCRQNTGPASPAYVPCHNIPMASTFWTFCNSCGMSFQYPSKYFKVFMKCPVCPNVFEAVEVPPPPTPIYANEPRTMDTSTSMGGAAVPDKAMPRKGVASGSQNRDPMLQRCSSTKSAAGAHTSSHKVQQTHGTVPGSSFGSSVPATSVLKRKVAEAKGKEAAKKRYKKVVSQSTSSGLDGDSSSQTHPAKRKARSTDRASGTKRRKEISNCLNDEAIGTSLIKGMEQLDMRGILIDKMKLQYRDKLEEFNRRKANVENQQNRQTSQKIKQGVGCSTAVDTKKIKRTRSSNSVHPEEDNGKGLANKKVVLEGKEKAQNSKCAGSGELESREWKKPEIRFVYTRRSREEQKPSPDEMLVPDADFRSFGDHPASSFRKDQVWATYDEEDGMPRYYALIRKVHSSHPFNVRLAFLKADDCDEFGNSDWLSCGYSKTCGDFRPGASKDIDQLNTFSHVVAWEKGPGRIIRIFPKKGDIWALYQNWSADWDELTPDETMYKYELVQVLDSYSPGEGISVMPLEKVPGFVSVFKPLVDPTKSRRIRKEEMLRFSHQVPFHVLTGEEADNSPKGCYELDPGSTPKELLHK
ncbi:uncharacterized protein [Lolium perenne]|uniref:uncharacterized protein n=1 Tax=Lolium perenne TaxID=4522 RepID=UPI0021F650E8|nr:uncharacterized protein LOC127345423 [Lolium perenne]